MSYLSLDSLKSTYKKRIVNPLPYCATYMMRKELFHGMRAQWENRSPSSGKRGIHSGNSVAKLFGLQVGFVPIRRNETASPT